MATKRYKVQVKPGRKHGVARHGGGSILEFSQDDLDNFGDKVIVLDTLTGDEAASSAPPQPDDPGDEDQVVDDATALDTLLYGLSVQKVLDLVEAGTVTADEAIKWEKERAEREGDTPRSTLLKNLEG